MFDERELERYQLRKAAGKYWLLDMEQDIDHYKQPVPLNEVGARIWELLCAGNDVDGVTEVLSDEYEADKSIIKKDAIDFIEQLYDTGVFSRSKQR